MQPIPDQDSHALILTEAAGTSTNHGGLLDGFPVSVRDLVDLRQGTGPQQGYVIYSKGADQEAQIDGSAANGLGGTWRILRGHNRWKSAEQCGHHPHPARIPWS